MSRLLCELTGGRLSKPTYPLDVMVRAIGDTHERHTRNAVNAAVTELIQASKR